MMQSFEQLKNKSDNNGSADDADQADLR